MKKIKFILPAVVFVFAFAISFASVKFYDDAQQVTEYYQKTTNPGQCIQIAPVCDRVGEYTCTVFSSINGGAFTAYDNRIDGSTCQAPTLRNLTPEFILVP